MLSYRHSFHAGNPADLLKHLTLALLLEKLGQKEKPFSYLDSHSAAGYYALEEDEAQKTGEYREGIARIWPDLSAYLPASLAQLITQLNADGTLRHYPGSPAIAQALSREQDRLQLIELHNREVEVLRGNLGQDPRISIHHRDGFEALAALLPPTPRRGLALIDPSYELKTDYTAVSRAVAEGLRRWATGVYAIWYPLLARERDQSQALLTALSALPADNLLVAELWVRPAAEDFGMHGSGMVILNAPYQLDTQLADYLPPLAQALAQHEQAGWRIEWLKAPR